MSNNQESTVHADARRLIEQRRYEDAVNLLNQDVSEHPDGEGHGLLAVAHFQLEDYQSATEHYEAALTFDSANQDWKEMLEYAKANSVAELHVPVPDVYYFDRDNLLASPTVLAGALPPDATARPRARINYTSPIASGEWAWCNRVLRDRSPDKTGGRALRLSRASVDELVPQAPLSGDIYSRLHA